MASLHPLGTLSHHQLVEGHKILKQIESQLKFRNPHGLLELSNQYYTTIPHAFSHSRERPPLINNEELLQTELTRLETEMEEAKNRSHIFQFDSKHGWFDFDPEASQKMEAAYQEKLKNPSSNHQVHQVKSGPEWVYDIDFDNMTQTNIQHPNHRVRNIRRVLMSQSRPIGSM